MIQKFIIKNKSMDTSLELELTKPALTGIYVKEVTGLGYPSSNISITNLVTSDIGHFNQSIFESRNVVFTLGFIPNAEVEKNRNKIYQVFIPKTFVRVEIYTDSSEKMRYVEGQVETCEPNIFSKDETIQISLICPNPYLIGETPIEKIFIGSPLQMNTNRQIEQECQIEVYCETGMDNIKLEYQGGSILYGSFNIIDPNAVDVSDDSNTIKPYEKFLVSTSINDYGIYLVNINDEERTEITQECIVDGNFPIISAGKSIFKIFVNGIIESSNQSGNKKQTIGDALAWRYLVEMSIEYRRINEDTSASEKVKPWNMLGGTSNTNISLYSNATGLLIYIYDRDMEDDISSKEIERLIGTLTINSLPERTSATDPTDERNVLNLFVVTDSEDNLIKVYLGRHYYNNGNYGDYTLFEDTSEELNPFYKGEKEVKNGLVNAIYDYKTHGTYGACFQTIDVPITSENKAYEYKDISSNIATKITYPDYYPGL